MLIVGKKNEYAIIIENKINEVIDQESQLLRYLESCISRGIRGQDIYAVYLTRDGVRTILNYSLTRKAKSLLGVSYESSGRFTSIEYKRPFPNAMRFYFGNVHFVEGC